MTPDVSVVTVTYRCREDALQCLDSLVSGGLEGVAAEVLLLDNASGDGVVEAVQARFPAVVTRDCGANLGFARANNQGWRSARGRLILFLNPDTIVPPGTVAACVDFLDRQADDVAGMGCRVESPDGSLQWECARRAVTPWSECVRALGLDRLVPTLNPERMGRWDRTDSRPVECLLGAFLLVRRSALERVGGFDERFFLMYEDVDLCLSLNRAGFRWIFWPDARIVHRGGASWRQEKVATYAQTHASALAYMQKHFPRALPLVRRVALLGLEGKLLALRLRRRDAWTIEHLAMAAAARARLRASGEASGNGRTSP